MSRELRPDTRDVSSHPCMTCGTTTPDSMFCDLCGGVYCMNHLPPEGEHGCPSQPEDAADS